jgi:hypothetical protein
MCNMEIYALCIQIVHTVVTVVTMPPLWQSIKLLMASDLSQQPQINIRHVIIHRHNLMKPVLRECI